MENQKHLADAEQIVEALRVQIGVPDFQQHFPDSTHLFPQEGIQADGIHHQVVFQPQQLRRNLETQKGAVFPDFMKLVGLIGLEQQQIPPVCLKIPSAAADCHGIVHQPDQLPLRVKMGGAVIHSIKEHAHSRNPAVADNLQLVHGGHSSKIFVRHYFIIRFLGTQQISGKVSRQFWEIQLNPREKWCTITS